MFLQSKVYKWNLSSMNGSTPMNVTAMDPNVSVEFMVNSTLEDILDKLMVEQWFPSITYESYYNECAPLKCTYTHKTKNSIVYIVTMIIGLIGGLITVLKQTVPRLVSFVAFCITKYRNNRVASTART
ncbi:unnamed protein product [Adineta ricciae]|uniref:Uncharacterized protein n=1 Tax=Adineta ricciae TaxID=249248 RepID=A0A815TWH3_ADIRI|nr:unnamed protein product [Adineta ricciae]